jgi:hypothetical protein
MPGAAWDGGAARSAPARRARTVAIQGVRRIGVGWLGRPAPAPGHLLVYPLEPAVRRPERARKAPGQRWRLATERGVWTDERLTESFELLRAEMAEMRSDIRDVRGEIRDLRLEVRGILLVLVTGLLGILGILAANSLGA